MRTLIGEVSVRIKVSNDEQLLNISEDGELKLFHFYYIYSEAVIQGMLKGMPDVASIEFAPDHSFKPDQIEASRAHSNSFDSTSMIASWQVSNYVLAPWSFVTIFKTNVPSQN